MLRLSCPAVTQALAAEHERRLGERYHARFTAEDVRAHIAALAGLSPERPVSASVRPLDARRVSCTVVAFDYPAEFSLITGILSSAGVSIVSGDAFTWSAAPEGTPPGLARRRIVDAFVGESESLRDPDAARALEERIVATIAPLETGTEEALARARRSVNGMAAAAIARAPGPATGELYPVQIEVHPAGAGRLAMVVTAQDTPFFLYTFSTALSLQGVAIEGVAIRTDAGRIEDSFEVADAAGRPFDDPGRVDRIRLAVLLTKQFTAFLGRAPDPLAALSRFEQLVSRVLDAPGQGRWLELLADGAVLADLARLLGASTFLWEDFVRQQYETLLPMLRPHVAGRRFAEPAETIAARLERQLAGAGAASDPEAFAERLNAFKDHEIFLYDLDHLLSPGSDFLELSRRLSALAEAVVDRAVRFAHRSLAARFGEPRGVAGIPARLAVLGLGKMGGAALGYASDIELLFVYSDAGATAGGHEGPLDNAEFFDRLVREVVRLVRAKREGIFHVDLRLRPYGQAGPSPRSLGASARTTRPAEPRTPTSAWHWYACAPSPATAGWARRSSACATSWCTRPPGPTRRRCDACASARSSAPCRRDASTPSTAPARSSTSSTPSRSCSSATAGPIRACAPRASARPSRRSPTSARWSRRRRAGSPTPTGSSGCSSTACACCAARPGTCCFRRRATTSCCTSPVAWATDRARASTPPGPWRSTWRRTPRPYGRFSSGNSARTRYPGPPRSVSPTWCFPTRCARTPPATSWCVAASATRHGRMPTCAASPAPATDGPPRCFARLAVLACDLLSGMPDPDMALNNWERYLAASSGPADRLADALAQPMRLEILLSLCSASQFLADTLIADPSLLDWLGSPGVLDDGPAPGTLGTELAERSAGSVGDAAGWREALRAVRRRQILRTGARDVCLGVSTRRVMENLSDLADALIAAALARAALVEGAGAPALCVIALGKLGARELNYSSDVDLLCLCERDLDPAAADRAGAVVRRFPGRPVRPHRRRARRTGRPAPAALGRRGRAGRPRGRAASVLRAGSQPVGTAGHAAGTGRRRRPGRRGAFPRVHPRTHPPAP